MKREGWMGHLDDNAVIAIGHGNEYKDDRMAIKIPAEDAKRLMGMVDLCDAYAKRRERQDVEIH